MGFWDGLETHNGCQLPRIVLFRARDNNGRGLDSSLFEPGYSRFRSSKKPWKVTHYPYGYIVYTRVHPLCRAIDIIE